MLCAKRAPKSAIRHSQFKTPAVPKTKIRSKQKNNRNCKSQVFTGFLKSLAAMWVQ